LRNLAFGKSTATISSTAGMSAFLARLMEKIVAPPAPSFLSKTKQPR
jgi:hypothetical protein